MDEDVSKSPKKALLIMLTYAHFSCSSSTSCLGQQTCRTPMGGKTRPEFQGGPAGRAIPTGNLSGKAGNGAPASSLCPQNLLRAGCWVGPVSLDAFSAPLYPADLLGSLQACCPPRMLLTAAPIPFLLSCKSQLQRCGASSGKPVNFYPSLYIYQSS